MTLLPVIERELRVAARQPAAFWGRFSIVATAVGMAGALMLLFTTRNMPQNQMGPMLFIAIGFIALIFCLLAGGTFTADSISAEKRNGTLGLLFLTDLTGADVVGGKLIASSINLVYGLVGMIPVMAIPLLLGGVSLATFCLMTLTLLNALFFSLAVGLLVSSISLDQRKATGGAALALGALNLWPAGVLMVLDGLLDFNITADLAVSILCFSPGFSLFIVLSPVITRGMGTVPWEAFWFSFGLTHLLTWLILWRTVAILPQLWKVSRTEGLWARISQWWHRLEYGRREARQRLRAELLTANPYLWLTNREIHKAKYVWLLLGAVLALWLLGYVAIGWDLFKDAGFPLTLLLHCFLAAWIATEAARWVAADKQSGAFELLLTTRLHEKDLIKGQMLALERQFALPVVTLLIVETIGLFVWLAVSNDRVLMDLIHAPIATLTLVTARFLLIPISLLVFWATAWAGLWHGVSAKQMNTAVAQALAQVVLVPAVLAGGTLYLVATITWLYQTGISQWFELRSIYYLFEVLNSFMDNEPLIWGLFAGYYLLFPWRIGRSCKNNALQHFRAFATCQMKLPNLWQRLAAKFGTRPVSETQ
jgi:hypothetical protein